MGKTERFDLRLFPVDDLVFFECSWDRIKKSRGREGSRPPSVGLDGVTAEKFDAHLEQNIEIHRLLSQPDSQDPSFPAYRFAPLFV